MRGKRINKPWGHEEIIVRTPQYVVKRIVINPGHRLSLQFHKEKEETIFVHKGTLIIWHSSEFADSVMLSTGESYHVPPGEVHRFGCPENLEPCILIECSTPQLNDVVRLEDDYNRK